MINKEEVRAIARQREADQIEWLEVVKDYVLDSDEVYANAGEALKAAKKTKKDIDDERTRIVKPLNEEVKEVNDFFRPALDKLNEIEELLKQMMGKYVLDKQAKQRQLLAAAAVSAAKQKVTDPDPPKEALTLRRAAAMAAPPTLAGVSVTEFWNWELVDESKVPLELKSFDSRKADAAVKAGARNVPGLRIFLDSKVRSTRTG